MVKKKIEVPDWSNERILADQVNDTVGSGKFILIQTIFLVAYILWNVLTPVRFHFDPYPFILLNLLLSFQAGYTGPFIVWAQNRAAVRDRQVMAYIHDMITSVKSVVDSLLRLEKRIDKDLREMQKKVEALEEQNKTLILLLSDIHREVMMKEGE